MADLRELRVFVAVAENLSFTRAAEGLHFTQQTVSKTIRDLEAELGVELLERTSREVRLTAAGEALLEPARETLRQAEAAFEAVRAVAGGRAGTVTVGFSPAVGPAARAAVVEALRADSERSVSARDLRPGELRDALRDRVVDVAVAVVSGTTGPGIDRTDLRPGQMQVHVPDDHRLAAAGTASLADFDGERLLAASAAGTPYTDLLVERFAAAGATVTPIESRVTGGSMLLGELAAHGAIAAMPAGTPSPPGVTTLATPGFTMPMVVLWPTGRPSEAATRLRDRLGP
jgi:DNA-binding transcriptional LysR family regulator